MQTTFVILASIFGLISAISFSTNQNILLSLSTGLVAAVLYLAAFLSRDKKDKQIEEIHSKITSRNQNKPTETSTEIINSYMETAHKIEDELCEKATITMNENLASRGIWSSGAGIVQTKDIKLSHIKSFINNCLEYIESTQNNYLLDKPSVKLLFENYQIADMHEITESVNKQNKARGLNIKQDIIVQEIMPPIISEINNAYSIALLRIDAM